VIGGIRYTHDHKALDAIIAPTNLDTGVTTSSAYLDPDTHAAPRVTSHPQNGNRDYLERQIVLSLNSFEMLRGRLTQTSVADPPPAFSAIRGSGRARPTALRGLDSGSVRSARPCGPGGDTR
jgi:hypothetical protein